MEWRKMYKTAVQILKATIGVESTSKTLLPPHPFNIEVQSLLTDFQRVDRIPYSEDLDGYIRILESSETPHYERHENVYVFSGPFDDLSRTASDPRFSFWGNQGFLYRYTLFLLEKHHKIYNLHACALFDPKRHALYLIIGGAGSGKTVYLLSGVSKGLRLFSTETVHFCITNGQIEWFKGSLVDNVRLGTLVHDFPEFLPDVELPGEDRLWQEKIALDLSSYATDFDTLRTATAVYILFPHIEQGRKGFIQNTIGDRNKSSKILFDNISQKIGETTILFDRIPVLGLDEKDRARLRLESVMECVSHPSISHIVSILSNPKDCWGNLLT
jgi:hypothetical protein